MGKRSFYTWGFYWFSAFLYFGIKLDQTHLDLRYILSALGFSGGLKSCEEKLGIGRKGGYEDIDGYFAVVLWQYYKKTKDIKALETLLMYYRISWHSVFI